MRIVYHCFTLQFWNLAHVKNRPVIYRHLVDTWFIHVRAVPLVNKSRIHEVPKNNPYLVINMVIFNIALTCFAIGWIDAHSTFILYIYIYMYLYWARIALHAQISTGNQGGKSEKCFSRFYTFPPNMLTTFHYTYNLFSLIHITNYVFHVYVIFTA